MVSCVVRDPAAGPAVRPADEPVPPPAPDARAPPRKPAPMMYARRVPAVNSITNVSARIIIALPKSGCFSDTSRASTTSSMVRAYSADFALSPAPA